MTRRRTAAALVGAVAALLLAACGSSTPSDGLPAETLPPEQVPAGISISIDPPVCVRAGSNDLCQFAVYFLNGTSDSVEVDATTLVAKDGIGTSYTGTLPVEAKQLGLEPSTRKLVLWSVTLPYGVKPVEVVWVSSDGRVAKALVTDVVPTPSPTGTDSESPSASTSAKPSVTPTPTKTATPTPSATPTPTKTATPTKSATPKPSPTRTRPSTTPPPGGSIG